MTRKFGQVPGSHSGQLAELVPSEEVERFASHMHPLSERLHLLTDHRHAWDVDAVAIHRSDRHVSP